MWTFLLIQLASGIGLGSWATREIEVEKEDDGLVGLLARPQTLGPRAQASLPRAGKPAHARERYRTLWASGGRQGRCGREGRAGGAGVVSVVFCVEAMVGFEILLYGGLCAISAMAKSASSGRLPA